MHRMHVQSVLVLTLMATCDRIIHPCFGADLDGSMQHCGPKQDCDFDGVSEDIRDVLSMSWCWP